MINSNNAVPQPYISRFLEPKGTLETLQNKLRINIGFVVNHGFKFDSS